MKLSHLNSVYINYLTPLLKWRVMDLESLRSECITNPNYYNFARVIRKMEKEKILQAYRHRFNGKKYIYFTSFGEGKLDNDRRVTAISKESLVHDIKVSEIARNLLKQGWVNNIMLEHELQNKKDFKAVHKIVPDALLETIQNGKKTKIAFELELTQKQKQRISEKAKQYIIHNQYDYIIYFFSKESVMKTYSEVIKKAVGEKNMNRFLFVVDIFITINVSTMETLKGTYQGRNVLISDFLTNVKGV